MGLPSIASCHSSRDDGRYAVAEFFAAWINHAELCVVAREGREWLIRLSLQKDAQNCLGLH
eukprot:2211947-Pyramimonas_sp.AAC.1